MDVKEANIYFIFKIIIYNSSLFEIIDLLFQINIHRIVWYIYVPSKINQL